MLKHWLLVYKYIILGNWGKTRHILVALPTHSFSPDCAKELFKPSKDTANLRLCNGKKILVWGFVFM